MPCALALVLLTCATTRAATHAEVQSRIDADVARGGPLVVHVVVALCDNANQGIVPVPRELGNGQNPRTNLYWGALYGLKTHFTKTADWTALAVAKPANARILERLVLSTAIKRGERSVRVILIADAWDGAHIEPATRAFLDMSAGRSEETVNVTPSSGALELHCGGAAHLIAYVGHDGLMDFNVPAVAGIEGARARSAIVLACASSAYFTEPLRQARAHPLLLTTGLMAPEAYTLDAAVRAWASGSAPAGVRAAAAAAYARYQRCGSAAALRLFRAEE